MTVGGTLADVTLPDGWEWDDDLSTSLDLVGEHEFPATFTPSDTDNYYPAQADLIVTVKPVLITFGSYPQSEVTDADLITALNAQTHDWQSYGYYNYSEEDDRIVVGDFMKYCDVTLDGAKYRGVRFSKYRPLVTELEAVTSDKVPDPYGYMDSGFSYQDDNGYYVNTTYGVAAKKCFG